MKFILLMIIMLSLTNVAESAQDAVPAPTENSVTKPAENSAAKPADTAVANEGVKVADIYVACKYYFSKLFNTRENVSRKNICNGYFFGSASMLLLLQAEKIDTKTCMPMDISTEEIIRGFLEWTDKNPDKMKLLASEALLKIIRQTYPCMEFVPKTKDKRN